MLVLTRRKNESLVIADRIMVTVLEVHRNRIRLGVDAPRDVPIQRGKPREVKGVVAG